MPQSTLELRVKALEKQVAELLAERAANKRPKDWRRTRGAFTGDDVMKRIFAEGRKIREAERKGARSRRTNSRKARS